MPRKRLVLVLVEVDAERWEANAFVRGQTLERFVREAVEHKISCHARIGEPRQEPLLAPIESTRNPISGR